MINRLFFEFGKLVSIVSFRKYSLSGGYRKILQIPKDSSWKIMHYKEKDDDFIQSDMHIIQQRPAPKDNPGKLSLFFQYFLNLIK